jgi:hypothetical protein
MINWFNLAVVHLEHKLMHMTLVVKVLTSLRTGMPRTYVCTNSSRHASRRISAPGRLFFYTLAN